MKPCPLCGGGADGTLENCRDFFCGIAGSWTYRRCGGCRSLWMDPLPLPEEISGFYPEAYYTHRVCAFASPTGGHALGRLAMPARLASLESRFGYTVPKEWWRRAGDSRWARGMEVLLPPFPGGRMVRFLPFRRGGRLLDVGCGNGEFLWRMRELGWEVEGIEPDGRAAEGAVKAGLCVRQGSIERMELEPDSYDAITLSHVIEHLLDPRAALAKCIAALRPGGTLVSLSPNPVGKNAKEFGEFWAQLDPPRHLVLPSLQSYRAALSGLPVRLELRTSPMQMGVFWKWSSSHRNPRFPAWLAAMYARWLDYIAGPLRVALHPEDGEECICIAHKEPSVRMNEKLVASGGRPR